MRKLLLFGAFFGLIGVPGLAAGQSGEAPEIVIADPVRDTYLTVVASGRKEVLDRTGQPLAIIGAEEVARVQGADIARVLQRLPGVTLSRNGGLGAFAGLRVRGADAEQLLVLIDGVPVADAAAPAGGFDFGTLLPAGIGKIELLRGSNSTIWGSQAVGGVLAVETREQDGGAASLEYGGPQTAYAQASAGRSWGPADLGIDGAVLDSRGFSSAAGGTEPDGVRQWQAGGRARLYAGSGLSLTGKLRHLNARLDLDGYPAPDFTLGDTAEFQETKRTDGSVGADYLGQDLSLNALYSLSDTRRSTFDPAAGQAPTYSTHGRNERASLRGEWTPTPGLALDFGAEREWSRMATLFDPAQSAASTGVYGQLGYRSERAVFNAGLRRDDHRGFGSEWSFGADGAVRLGESWRLRASYGEGFKAPTLFQRFSEYGNDALVPERSRSFDLGIDNGDRNSGGPFFSMSAFRRESEDLIDFVSCFGTQEGICEDRPFGTYGNIGKARAQGVEAEAAIWLGELHLQGVYSYVEAVNRTSGTPAEGNDLARRPRHSATLSADWQTLLSGLSLGADLRVVSASYDDAANLVRLSGHAVLTLRGELPLTDELTLFGRIENLWDEQYQTAAGYASPGRGAYLGARARF